MRRVVITGMGVDHAAGRHASRSCSTRQLAGRSGVGPITRFDASHLPDHVRRRGARTSTWRATSADAGALGATPARPAGSPPPRRGRRWRTPACSTTAGDRTRFGVYLGSGEGVQDFHAAAGARRPHSYRPEPRRAGRRRASAGRRWRATTAGREYEQELHTPSAHLADALRPGRAELHLPDRLRRQQPGHRRGARADPPRRRRPDARRRRAQHDPPARRDRVQPADGPLDAQRRPAEGVAAVRPAPRRLRAGRRGGHAWSWRNWSTRSGAARRSTPS